MENSKDNMHTDVGALRVNKRKKKQQTDSLTKVVLTFLLWRAMTGEFSLDLHCLSAGGGERLCDEICVSKFNLLMSGSLSIRLPHKLIATTDVT